MSKIDYCPRGGQAGILVTTKELQKLSKALGVEYIDQYITIPQLTIQEQVKEIPNDKSDCIACNCDPTWYWENKDTGSHGWCCCNCGKVSQWG